MSKLFNGTSSYLSLATAPATAVPLTMACFFRTSTLATLYTLMSISDNGGNVNYFDLRIGTGNKIIARANDAGANGNATGAVSIVADTWGHACAVFSSTTSRNSFLDGTDKSSNATAVTPAGIDDINIGRRGGSTPTNYFAGYIAHAAIWNVALSDAEVAELGTALKSPLLVRPASLVFYAPLWSGSIGCNELRGGVSLSDGGVASSAGVEPRIFQRGTRRLGSFHPAAATGIRVPRLQIWQPKFPFHVVNT